jgi:hypothetical protein
MSKPTLSSPIALHLPLILVINRLLVPDCGNDMIMTSATHELSFTILDRIVSL